MNWLATSASASYMPIMSLYRLPWLPVLLLALVVQSCETVVLPANDAQATPYFPLEEGREWVYALDTIHYRETAENDTARWFLREVIGTPYQDLTNQTAYPIERWRRSDTTLPWRYFATGTAAWRDGQLQWSNNNLRVLRLVSPATAGVTWNGHIPLADLSVIPTQEECNNWSFLANWMYTYSSVGSFALESTVFDSVITVEQAGEQNLIEFNDGEARFAAGVGLIERSFRHLTTQDICPECPWEEKVSCGFAVTQRLLVWQ